MKWKLSVKFGDTLEICDEIIFDFYLGLPYMYIQHAYFV